MLFNEFGSKSDPPVLLMHGMMQDWQSIYKFLQPLEKDYRLIIPAMDGFYDGSSDFTSFADQARQIEDYVKTNCEGTLFAVHGTSQGALLMVELLSRNNIEVKSAILDGVYVAHQGKLAGWFTFKMFRLLQNNGGKIPNLMHITLSLMGLKKEDLQNELDILYLGASENSMRRNFMENYTYRVSPKISESDTKVYLWCGSKEPYAIKSHKILKRYLKNYEEEIMEGYGHGEFLVKHQKEMCERIVGAIGHYTHERKDFPS